ncbi:MAG TPA: acetyltransferase [Burkholderiales bacterium]|nr:acetyltransferase [Burkholderiales bacterium]
MGKFYDIFNGDADGLCALQQLRLEEPRAAELVTGVKRDLRLVERVKAQAGDELTVLDINFTDNADAVERALARGAVCRYFDHHTSGRLPEHPNFKPYIDTAPDVCTSLLVDRYLSGRQRLWAVVGAFGDNLVDAALRAAQSLELDHTELARLHELGECLNYNAYGDSLDDLHYPPAELHATMAPYRDPRHFVYDEPVFDVLRSAYVEDLARAEEIRPQAEGPGHAVYVLPDAAWSRRVSGAYGNRLAQHDPQRAHAVLVARGAEYVVSVRAPVARPTGASALCRQFATGGGREAAGGINHLPQRDVDRFIAAFRAAYD